MTVGALHGEPGVRTRRGRALSPSVTPTIGAYPGLRMGQIPRADGPRTSETWIKALRFEGASREEAIADLYALLLRAARFELRRRRAALSHVRGEELDDISARPALV